MNPGDIRIFFNNSNREGTIDLGYHDPARAGMFSMATFHPASQRGSGSSGPSDGPAGEQQRRDGPK